MKKHFWFPAVAALAILLSACAVPPAPPPRQLPAGVNPSPLAGTSWLLAALNDQSPVEGTSVTLNFEPFGRASGSDGCNNYTTTYTVDGSKLTFGPAAATMMACPEPIMQQATAYQQMLAQTASYKIEGERLTLMDAGGKALATFDPQSAELAGTSWNVLSYNNGKEAVVSVIIGTKLTVTFGADGRLSGNAGCNDYSGDYKTEGEKITVGPLAATQKFCDQPEGVMEQEAQYLAALQSAATYRVDGNTMEMRTADGALAAVFQRAASTQTGAGDIKADAAGITPAPEGLSIQALANATHSSDLVAGGTVTLSRSTQSRLKTIKS